MTLLISLCSSCTFPRWSSCSAKRSWAFALEETKWSNSVFPDSSNWCVSESAWVDFASLFSMDFDSAETFSNSDCSLLNSPEIFSLIDRRSSNDVLTASSLDSVSTLSVRVLL